MAARRRFEGFIFDLDGTLVDSFADIAAALNDTRVRYGFEPLSLAEVRGEVGSGSPYLVRALVPVPAAEHEAALQHYLVRYEQGAVEQSRLYPGVETVLDRLAGRKLAVVTNKAQHLAERVLRGLGVWERFDLVVGGDALPRCKPDPLPLLHVLEHFGLAAGDVLMVGDGLHDMQAAKAAGMFRVAVSTGVESPETLLATGPDLLLASLDELLLYVE